MLFDPPLIPSRPSKSSPPASDPESTQITQEPAIPRRPRPAPVTVDPVLPPRPVRTASRPVNASPAAPPSIPRRPTRSDVIASDSMPFDGIASAGEGYDAGDEAKYSQSETDEASLAPSYSGAAWGAASPADQHTDIINIKSLTEDNVGLDGAANSHQGGYESGDEARADSLQIPDTGSRVTNEFGMLHDAGSEQERPVTGIAPVDDGPDSRVPECGDDEEKVVSESHLDTDDDVSYGSRDDGACTPQTTETRLTFKNEPSSLTDAESGFDDDDETIMPDAHDCQSEHLDFGGVNAVQDEIPSHDQPAMLSGVRTSATDREVEQVSSPETTADQYVSNVVHPTAGSSYEHASELQPDITMSEPEPMPSKISNTAESKVSERDPADAGENTVKSSIVTAEARPEDTLAAIIEPFIPARPKRTSTSSTFQDDETTKQTFISGLTDSSEPSQQAAADLDLRSLSVAEYPDMPLKQSLDGDESLKLSGADGESNKDNSESASKVEHAARLDMPSPGPFVPTRPAKKDLSCETVPSPSSSKSKAPPPKPKKLSAKMSAFQQMFEINQKSSSDSNTENKPSLPSKRPQGQTRLSDDKMRFAQSLKGVMGRGIPMPGMVPIGSLADDSAAKQKEAETASPIELETASLPSPSVPKLRVKGPRGRKLPSTFKEPVALEPVPSRFTIASHRLFEIGGLSKDTPLSTTTNHDAGDAERFQPGSGNSLNGPQAASAERCNQGSSMSDREEEDALWKDGDEANISTKDRVDKTAVKRDNSEDKDNATEYSTEQRPIVADLDIHHNEPQKISQATSNDRLHHVDDELQDLSHIESDIQRDTHTATSDQNPIAPSRESDPEATDTSNILDEYQDDAAEDRSLMTDFDAPGLTLEPDHDHKTSIVEGSYKSCEDPTQ